MNLPAGFVGGSWCVIPLSDDDRAFISLIARRHTPDVAPVLELCRATRAGFSILNHLEPRRAEETLVRPACRAAKAWAAGVIGAREQFLELARAPIVRARVAAALKATPEGAPLSMFVEQLRRVERLLPRNRATLAVTSEGTAVFTPAPRGRDEVVHPLIKELSTIGCTRPEIIRIVARVADLGELATHRWLYRRRLFPVARRNAIPDAESQR